ncbi:cation acetate symporter [Actinokineospora globicatena]|uniref:Cation acetate symporter n=1 Tax=Actinokineospora globicatena TaxID=103729 RepID=A0A9W6VAJ7_9PSEU|nr:cation acetate symporter [Actinokineospora globicatena]MCP2301185.1 Sodium:solute symporter family protein [Actinokineospora globicatena]GLW77179.1 cation acetate symporter [Actinokineospora globicatena]GLW84013.1 cation acetate symporter [Actinokineospora globicatena]GLW92043.1 cation acetate symporter [Actinokineospora globicatena]
MELNVWAVVAIGLVSLATFSLGYRSSRLASTTQDFLVARRTVRSRRNAAAVSGEYLSAASFLGVAGLVLKDGADALWYPIGFTAGYLVLMLFVAAPLRRSGAYTLPDFCEARLGSAGLRRLATATVVFIGILYLVPQFQGAGLTVHQILPSVPSWIGSALVAVLVIVNVFGGGMRAVTLVQAFQYWLKLFAIAAPTFVLCVLFFGQGGVNGLGATGLSEPMPPRFTRDAVVTVETDVVLQVKDGVLLWANGRVHGTAVSGPTYWGPGDHPVDEGTELRFSAGSETPVVHPAVLDNASWLRPVTGTGDLFTTYSLIIGLFLGTMGLPHVLVRFYTNPDGKAARRTTLHVLLLLGLFYVFPILIGALSRVYAPELLVAGRTDAAVLALPLKIAPNTLGEILGAVTAAGAFAAFLSTSSGLVVSVAGVLSTDILKGRVRDFRFGTALAGGVPLALALVLRPSDISLSIGMTFALAASTFSPVLLLGIWWRKITWVGAAAGMVVGGSMVLTSIVLTTVSGYTGGWAPSFLQQPALVTVPVAFLVVVVTSKATQSRVPPDTNRTRLRMHAPDRLGFIRDRDILRFGNAEERTRLANGRHRR